MLKKIKLYCCKTLVICLSSLLLLSNSAVAEESSATKEEITKLEKRFIKIVTGAASVGALYAMDIQDIKGKLSVIRDCCLSTLRSTENFFSEDSKQSVDTFHECIKSHKYTVLKKDDANLSGLDNFWIACEHDNRAWYQIWGELDKYYVPHPLLVIAKITDELGVFAFSDQEDGKYRDLFALYVKDGIKFILNKDSYGDETYKQKLIDILQDLESLCKEHSRFTADSSSGDSLQNRITKKDLITLGRAIQEMIVFADTGLMDLSQQEQVELGIFAAYEFYPTLEYILDYGRSSMEGKSGASSDANRPTTAHMKSTATKIANKYKGIITKKEDSEDTDLDFKINNIQMLAGRYEGILRQIKEDKARREHVDSKNINMLLEYLEEN